MNEIERWGALSVKDHLDHEGLVADILLYDRLIFPVFSGPGERTRWRGEDWMPDLQEIIVQELGPVAVKADWNEDRRAKYGELRAARKEIAEDAFQTTRWVLAMDQEIMRPAGEVQVIAAYHDWNNDWGRMKSKPIGPDEEALGLLGFAVSQKLLAPTIEGPVALMEKLKEARDLSSKETYRAKRARFYEWQESAIDAIARGRRDLDTKVCEMEKLVDELNREIMGKWTRFGVKTVCSVLKIVLPFVEVAETLKHVGEAGIEALGGGVELSESRPNRKCEFAAMIVTGQKLAH